MKDSIHLGRLAGIRVGAHWSLLIVFALIAWSLAAAQLPLAAPGQTVAAYWAVGLVTAALFFASLLAHEMGHALLARSRGVEIEGITLWLFGGVSKLRDEATDPGVELRIAAVGPGVSLALAAVFLLLAAVLAAGGTPALVVAAATWLGVINAILAVFNLLPAFPLDGGRVLRALLWMRSGRLDRATRTASTVGSVFAYSMIGLGIVLFVLGDLLDGIWLAFLGWFLLMAARDEATATLVRDALAGLRVADVMSRDPVVIPGWTTVEDLVHRHLLAERYSSYPICDVDGRLTGMVTLDLLRRVAPEHRTTTRLSDIARPLSEVVTARPDEPFSDLVMRLASAPGGRALVFEGDRLVGIVSPTDVSRALAIADLRAAPPVAR